MRTIALEIMYDGTDFSGWQVQPEHPTIQGCLEGAVRAVTQEASRVIGAGRTDSGVHALGQVAHFRTESTIPPEKFADALNSQLPSEIVVRRSWQPADDFHAIASAIGKRYRYLILNAARAHPLLQNRCWRIESDLDVAAMQEAAACLVGTHDFRSFETHYPNRATSVRTVTDLVVRTMPLPNIWSPFRLGMEEPDRLSARTNPPERLISVEIAADGFLYNMVRAITGTLVKVGRSAWPVQSVPHVLAAQDRAQAAETAPACGLYFVEVTYPEDASV